MGIVSREVAFQGTAPPLSRVVDKITEIGGLPLEVQESSAEIRGDLFDMDARIGFACLTNHDIKIYSYRNGAVKEFLEKAGPSMVPIAKVMVGANEPAGIQTVYLEGYRGQELSIMDLAVLALESLGGQPRTPPSPQMRDKYAKPLTASQMNRRKYSLRLRSLAYAAVAIMAAPFALIYVACILVFIRLCKFGSRAKKG